VDPFATLGIARAFDVDLDAVARVHRELSRALHPDRYLGAAASERRAALARAVEVNEAFRVVRDPIRRAEALLRLGGAAVEEGSEPRADPEFLMDMLEQREALGEARRARDLAGVRRLAASVEARAKEVERALAAALAVQAPRSRATPGAEGASGGEISGAVTKLGELRFYRRFLDEVSAIEDELAA
jgi:molecular chaperone HscB